MTVIPPYALTKFARRPSEAMPRPSRRRATRSASSRRMGGATRDVPTFSDASNNEYYEYLVHVIDSIYEFDHDNAIYIYIYMYI